MGGGGGGESGIILSVIVMEILKDEGRKKGVCKKLKQCHGGCKWT